MKLLFIFLSLLLLGAQQGVASEKRAERIKPTRQTKLQKEAEKGDGMAKYILKILNPTPVNIVAIHEYIQTKGYKSTLEESKDAEKYITFQSDSLSGYIHADGEYITFQTSLRNPGSYVARMTKQDEITGMARAIVYRACLDLMYSIRCVKATYYEEDDWISATIETFIPTMPVFERYFNTYMSILSDTSNHTVHLLDQYIESANK